MRVVCIIPTLNECSTIGTVILHAKQRAHRVVVVDGNSQDNTVEEALKAGAEVLLQEGTGKGIALRTAFSKCNEDIYVIIDGDATYSPLEMHRIIQPLIEGCADMVIGSRFLGERELGAISFINVLGNRLFNFLINTLFDGKLTDSQSGFRGFHKQMAQELALSSTGFEVETELTVKALKARLRVLEVPISYKKRPGTKSKLNPIIDGLSIVKLIFTQMTR